MWLPGTFKTRKRVWNRIFYFRITILPLPPSFNPSKQELLQQGAQGWRKSTTKPNLPTNQPLRLPCQHSFAESAVQSHQPPYLVDVCSIQLREVGRQEWEKEHRSNIHTEKAMLKISELNPTLKYHQLAPSIQTHPSPTPCQQGIPTQSHSKHLR